MRLKISLKQAWIGLILIVGVVPVAVVAIWYGQQIYQIKLGRALDSERHASELLRSRIENEIKRYKTLLKNKSDPLAILVGRTGDPDAQMAMNSLLKFIMVREAAIHEVMILSPQAHVITAIDPSINVTGDRLATSEELKQIKAHLGFTSMASSYPEVVIPSKGRDYIGALRVHQGDDVFSMAVPIGEPAKAVLVIFLIVEKMLSPAFRFHERSINTGNVRHYIVDRRGSLRTEIPGSGHKRGDVMTHLAIIRTALIDGKWASESSPYVGATGQPVYGTLTTIPYINWSLISEVNAEHINGPIRMLLFNISIATLFCISVVVWLAIRLAGKTLRPIQETCDAFGEVANGNYDITLHPSAVQELNALSTGFNNMAASRLAAERILKNSQRERELAEEGLRRSQRMDAIGQLSGGIAHDFNNILGIIIGNLSFLKRGLAKDAKALERVETADKAARRGADLTRQLLGFSRSQAQQVQPTDLNLVVQRLDGLISRSVTPEVEVEHYLCDDLWWTEIDPADFEDALLNLVLNARDAMPRGGKLTIETFNTTLDAFFAEKNPTVTPGEYVEISISDTGKGMTEYDQQRIFEPFFTTKERGKGTGLGMSMVFGFIQRSKGHIDVDSESGAGTRFRCYLPRFIGKSETQKSPVKDKIPPPPGDETVLLVDDEEDLLKLTRDYLETSGYTVVTAASGQQALEVLSGRSGIDLLFSDVIMPGGINGYELAEQAVRLYPGLKVLLTSGHVSSSFDRNDQVGFKANLLNKPYNEDELAKRIRLVLDERA